MLFSTDLPEQGDLKSAKTCRKLIHMRIFKIKRVLERLQSLKAALERSVRTPVIIALYQEYTGKAVVQSVQVVKKSGEDNACFESSPSDSKTKKCSSFELKMIDDKKFFDFVLESKEYKENQTDVREFVNGIRNYKKELSHMCAEYSSLLEHVNYLFSIGKKN